MPKIYAACGAAGFALSFLIGLFSGAAFLLILARALIFGAAFAALAVLFNFLLRRFVPDLFDKDAPAAPKPKERASKVDITISDDASSSPEEDDSVLPDFMKDRSRGKSGAGGASGKPSSESVPAGEDAQDAPAPAQAEDGLEPSLDSDDSAQGGLAAMPDASTFADDDGLLGDDEEAGGDAPYAHASISANAKNSNLSASGVDAETMARAIRTVLSKDG